MSEETVASVMEDTSNPKFSNLEVVAEQLVECLKENDLSRARHLLKNTPGPLVEKVVSCTLDDCAPLFVASKAGNIHFVRHLVEDWKADVEQKGVYEVGSDHSRHKVTPLWCAAVANKLEVVKFLAEWGANINATSDSQSTPVRSACFMTNIEVVKYLVGRGADIHTPNHNGGTCLINSVQNDELCQLLISKGVDVNFKDSAGNTALHYAIREGRKQTVTLLLKHSASPTVRNDFGDDAVVTACLRGYMDILEQLIEYQNLPLDQIATAYELIGTHYVDEKHDMVEALEVWRKACRIRCEQGKALTKSALVPPKVPYMRMTEAVTLQELDDVAGDPDAIHMQSLLIRERILGAQHKDTVFGLMYRGAVYADMNEYQRCVDLWKYAFILRHDQDDAIGSECIFTLQALCKLFWEIHEEFQSGFVGTNVCLDDVMEVLRLSVQELLRKKDLPMTKPSTCPVTSHQSEISPDMVRHTMLVLVLHLANLILELTAHAENIEFKRLVHSLIRSDMRGVNAQTLLHLACEKKMSHIGEDFYSQFPSLELTRMLIECGADCDALDQGNSTPLHVCAEGLHQLHTHRRSREIIEDIVDLLLASGAHIDVINERGVNVCDIIKFRCPRVHVMDHVTLKCLTARAIANSRNIDYKCADIPASLVPFIDLHKGKADFASGFN